VYEVPNNAYDVPNNAEDKRREVPLARRSVARSENEILVPPLRPAVEPEDDSEETHIVRGTD